MLLHKRYNSEGKAVMKKLLLLLNLIGLLFPFNGNAQIKPGTEEQYQTRLSVLKSPVDLSYNPQVKKHIDAYLENPEKTREIIGMSKVYFPMIEKALRVKNLPTDLKYFAVALSELDPLSQNPYGATGMWMMMYNVSKMYKLKVNSFVDERKDIRKSTATAVTHFKDLFSIYKQWPLVIASYACSPVMLNKCIRMAGNSLYFWDVYPFIPENTREAYPRFVAAAYIMNYYKEHGIKPVYPDLFNENDSVLVNKWLSFQQISATIDIPLEQLRKLNPVFKKDIIPYNVDGYWIYLPKTKGRLFELLKDTVYNPLPKPTEFAPVAIQQAQTDTTKTPTPTETATQQAPNETTKFDKKRVSYTVKKGDILSDVADWFDVTPKEIKSWNKLKSDKLKRGQKITIWVKHSKTGYYKRINSMSTQQKKKLKKKD